MPGSYQRRRGAATRASVDLPLRRRRQELVVEDILGLGLALVGEGETDLVERPLEPAAVDAAEAVLTHPGGGDVLLDRHREPLELDLLARELVALQHRIDGGGGVGDRVAQALGKGAQEAPHGLRLLGRELLRDQDRVAIELEAMLAHRDDDNVVRRYA